MAADLLNELDAGDVELFFNDFKLLMRLAVETDREYGRADYSIGANMPKYEEYIDLFNKKYPGVLVTPSENFERRFLPEIFIKSEKSVRETFFNSAAKIHRVKAISASGCLHKDSVEDEVQFKKEIAKIKNKLCIQYYGIKSLTVFLSYSPHREMVEICYDPKTVCDKDGPEFKVIAYYAIKDSDINYEILLEPLGENFTSNVFGMDTSTGGKGPLR
ncbi:MAG: hypothetical protein Q8O89_00200 [Nanoarchaeota archaeon]|nr:hypothetical protein [Nanoarchaeota archaeon]